MHVTLIIIKYLLFLDQGLCEIVMARDDIAKDLQKNGTLYAYPGNDDSDEEDLDALTESYDIQMGNTNFLCLFVEIIFFFFFMLLFNLLLQYQC